MSPSFPTSHCTPRPSTSEATCFSFSKERSARTKPAAPSCLKRSAAARPMPLAAPVITATLPFRSIARLAPGARQRLDHRGLLAELHLGDGVAVHLVRTIGE